jgi:hypothetical protein
MFGDVPSSLAWGIIARITGSDKRNWSQANDKARGLHHAIITERGVFKPGELAGKFSA